jgi:hypothetical protein
MKLSELKPWLNKSCRVLWLDSGAWNHDEEVEPKDMPLGRTWTSGTLVYVGQQKIVIEHEKESSEDFVKQTHSIIWRKCVLEITNKKRG